MVLLSGDRSVQTSRGIGQRHKIKRAIRLSDRGMLYWLLMLGFLILSVSGMEAGMRGRLFRANVGAQMRPLDFNQAGHIGASDQASRSSQRVLPLVYVGTGFDQSTSHYQRLSNPTNLGMDEQVSRSDTMLGPRRTVSRTGTTGTDSEVTETDGSHSFPSGIEFSEIVEPVLVDLTKFHPLTFGKLPSQNLLERTITLWKKFWKELRRTDPQPRDPFYTSSMHWIIRIVLHVFHIDPVKKHEVLKFCSEDNAARVESYITAHDGTDWHTGTLKSLVDDLITENQDIHFDKFHRYIIPHEQRDGQSSHLMEIIFQDWLAFRRHQKTLASILTGIPRNNPPNYSRENWLMHAEVGKILKVAMIGKAAKKLLSTIAERHPELGNIKPFSSYVEKLKTDARMALEVHMFEIVARDLLTPLKVWGDILLSRQIDFTLQPFEPIYLFLDQQLCFKQHKEIVLNWLVILHFYVELTEKLKPQLSDDGQLFVGVEIMKWFQGQQTVYPSTALAAQMQHYLRIWPLDTWHLRWISNQLTSPLCEVYLNNMSASKIQTLSHAPVLKSPQTGNLVRSGLQPLPLENSRQSLYGIHPTETISAMYPPSNTVPISKLRPGTVTGSPQDTHHSPAQLQRLKPAYMTAFSKPIISDIYPKFGNWPRLFQSSSNSGNSPKIESIFPVPISTSKTPISNVEYEGVKRGRPTNIPITSDSQILVTDHIPVTDHKSVKKIPFAPGVREKTSLQSLKKKIRNFLPVSTENHLDGTSRSWPPQVKRLKSSQNPESSDPLLKPSSKLKFLLTRKLVQKDGAAGSSAAVRTVVNSGVKQSEKGQAPFAETTSSNAPGVGVRASQTGSPVDGLESTESVLERFEWDDPI